MTEHREKVREYEEGSRGWLRSELRGALALVHGETVATASLAELVGIALERGCPSKAERVELLAQKRAESA